MLNIKSFEDNNGVWTIVTYNITINPSVAKEAGLVIAKLLGTKEELSIECVARTLNAYEKLRSCAEYLTVLQNEGMDTDGDYESTFISKFLN